MSSKSYHTTGQLLLNESLKHHQEGRLGEAATGYQKILEENPQHSDALHLLGVVAQQMNKLDMAIELIKAAIAQNPSMAHYYHNLGNTYLKNSQAAEAVNCYRQAILLTPNYVEAHFGMGNALAELNQFEIAIEAYQMAVNLRPSFAEGHYSLGKMYSKLEKFDAAITSYRTAILLDGETSEHLNLALAEASWHQGNLWFNKSDYAKAFEFYNWAIEKDPQSAKYYSDLGLTLIRLERFHEAIVAYQKSATLAPENGDLHFGLGIAQMKLNQFDAAETSFRCALKINPGNIEAKRSLGASLGEQFRFKEAAACYRDVLAIDPASSATISDLALCLYELDENEALNLYRQALQREPDNSSLHTSFSYALLSSGRYTEGWKEHEWRWRSAGFPSKQRDFGRPLWTGQPLNGDKILIYWEQGYGDTLQFIRYIPLISERGGRVILEVQPALRRLLNEMSGVEQFIADGDPLPQFSWQCPLMSLPLAFNTTLETIPSACSYLSPPNEEVKRMQESWPGSGLRIGLAWRGNPKHRLDTIRSMSLNHFAPFSEISGVTFYSLQVGEGTEQIEEVSPYLSIVDVCSRFSDFSETAAFIAGLDLVITIDTVIAHLAGAMGIPVWILLPHNRTDWRWLRRKTDNPWYPTARLFRQPEAGNWAGLVEIVKSELSKLVKE